MELRVDHSFHIGEQHLRTGKPCQDFAQSGIMTDTIAYIVVSDGCSSGGQTDIGARLLTLATERALKENVRGESDSVWSFLYARDTYAEAYRSMLQLQTKDMLATNMFAVSYGDSVLVHVTGDGVVALQYEDGLQLYRFDWEQNMPYYPAYRLGKNQAEYRAAQADFETPLTMRSSSLFAGYDSETPTLIDTFSIDEGMDGVTLSRSDTPDGSSPGRLLAVGLFSDGVEQVDQFETTEVIQALMSFKSTNGQFATRRMNRFLQEAHKRGRGPLDDIAMAVVHLGR